MPGHRLRGAGLPTARPRTAATAVPRKRLRTATRFATADGRAIAHVSDTRISSVIQIWTGFRVRGTLRTARHAASSLLGAPGCRVGSSTALVESSEPSPAREGFRRSIDLGVPGVKCVVVLMQLVSRSHHADRGTTPSPSSHTSPSRPKWAAMRAAGFRRRKISTQPWPRRSRPRGVGRRQEGPGRLGTRAPP